MSGFSVGSQEKDPSKFALAIQQLYAGRSNAAGSVTLAAGEASTTVDAAKLRAAMRGFPVPENGQWRGRARHNVH